MSRPNTVRDLLREHGVRPRKRWGQHFLCDRGALERVVAAAHLRPDECVLEIGPGLGALTGRIAPQVQEVVAVEIDPRLVRILRELLRTHRNVRIIEGDALKLEWAALLPPGERVKAMGNLPYGITAPLLEKLVEHRERVREAIWMVQREVAGKLLVPPGNRGTSALGIYVQAHLDAEAIARVSKGAFFPRPEVDATVLRLAPLPRPRYRASAVHFRRTVRAAFGTRRKTIRRALALSPELKLNLEQVDGLLERAGIDGGRRGETLSLEELDRLALELEALGL